MHGVVLIQPILSRSSPLSAEVSTIAVPDAAMFASGFSLHRGRLGDMQVAIWVAYPSCVTV